VGPTCRPGEQRIAQREEAPVSALRFSVRARADTFALWDELATSGDRFGSSPVDPIDAADAFAARLSEACARITGDPACGMPRDDVVQGLRVLPTQGCLVAGGAGVDIVRVLPPSLGG
jgi:plasmid stabilization system protein ParE